MTQFTDRAFTRQSVKDQSTFTLTLAAQTITIYTVPAGKDFFLRMVSAADVSNALTRLQFVVTSGAKDYNFEATATVGAAIYITALPNIYLTDGDILKVRVFGGTVGDTINFNFFGELLELGQWE